MKRPSLGGLTAIGVLVLAIGGGAVGGALATGGQQTPAPGPVQVQSIADEATSTPAPSPSPSPAAEVEEAPAPDGGTVDAEPAPAPQTPEVSDPAPIVEPVAPSAETASQAADRAKAEADRAKAEADRAAEVAATATPKPKASTPVTAPQPECSPEGGVITQPLGPAPRGMSSEQDAVYGGGQKTCRDGKWVETKPNILIEHRDRTEVQGEKTCEIREKRVDKGPWQELTRVCNPTSQEDPPEG